MENSTNPRIRILLLIPHLGGGGAERVIQLLASNLSQKKYELHLAVAVAPQTSTRDLPSGVRIHFLNARRVRRAAFPLLRLVWQLRPRVILSGMFHFNFLALLLRPFLPRPVAILVRQNGTVSAALAADKLPAYTRMFYRHLYPRADRVICQSQAMAADLVQTLGIPADRLSVLPNPIDVEAVRDGSREASGTWAGPGPHLLAIGRLSREKGFDLLLKALPLVRRQFPYTDLLIAGSGPEESALRAQCQGLGIASAVRFAGYVEQPASWFPGVSAFVLPSRHEGMPNALLEAAAGGLPLVALPASKGICALLNGQPGAWIAPEVSTKALAGTLIAALSSLEPGQRFPHSWIEQFQLNSAVRAYEALIDQFLTGHAPDRSADDPSRPTLPPH